MTTWQSQSYNDYSRWCSKQSRYSFSRVLGKCSFNSKPLTVNLQAKHNCKSHTALSRKFPLFVKYYLTWLLIPVVSRYNTNLKLHNRKVVENAFEVIYCCHLLSARYVRSFQNIYSKFSLFLATTGKKWVIWGPELRLLIRVFYMEALFLVIRSTLNYNKFKSLQWFYFLKWEL